MSFKYGGGFAGSGGGGAQDLSGTDIDTLAEINNLITDATLIDTGDSRLSDERTPLDGSVGFAKTDTDLRDLLTIGNGIALDSPAVTITFSAGTVYLNLEQDGGGDIRFLFSDGVHIHDCTPIATVALTAGSDASPTENWIYIDQATKTLTASTVGFPTAEFAPIATVVVQSGASLATDGAMKVHAWTDHASGADEGHLAHINSWIRSQNATWQNGVAVTPTAGAGTMDIATTSGSVLQLHPHNFPAFDTSTGSEIYVVNDPDAAYTKVASLTQADGVDKDANGTALGGASTDFYNLVLWGVVNESDADCKLMLNLPDGAYPNNNAAQAELDANSTAVYTIPDAYRGVGFLIARLTIEENAGTYSVIQNTDLRGLFPSTGAGGGAGGASNEFADNVFRVQDEGDTSKQLAFELSGVTTETTRTVTVPDADGTLQLQPSEGAFVNGDKTKLDGIEASADVTDAANVTTALASINIYDHEYVNAGAMVPRTTNGAEASTLELATNDIALDVFAFDSVTEEGVGFWIRMPIGLQTGSDVLIAPDWTTIAGSAGGVTWGFKSRSFGNDDTLDAVLPTSVDVDDTWIADNDLHVAPTSAAITITDVADGELIYVEITRKVNDANDTMGADALLMGVQTEIVRRLQTSTAL